MPNVLIIDDDQDICGVLSKFLKKNKYEVGVAHTGEDGLKELGASDYSLVLCDYRLPDMTGVETLRKIRLQRPRTAVIIITGYSDVKSAVETFKYGASDYVTKPLYPDELLVTIRETIAKNEMRNSGEKSSSEETKAETRNNKTGNDPVPFIVGKSEQALMVQRYIELIAPADMSVIITGETGTGKEFVAQSIHRLSKRSDKPFIAIDCGTLSKELAGSELFGHMKGSFTGALNDKEGHFELANGGTLFLDEVANLSVEIQAALLRVIQERKFKRVGGNKEMETDVRIIVASNENLQDAYRKGKFREDLFHRFNEFSIVLPAFRNRKEDIPLFADFFLAKANKELNKEVEGFEPEVMQIFMNYPWPGNLREFRNVIRRAALLTSSGRVNARVLPAEIVDNNGFS